MQIQAYVCRIAGLQRLFRPCFGGGQERRFGGGFVGDGGGGDEGSGSGHGGRRYLLCWSRGRGPGAVESDAVTVDFVVDTVD